MSNVTYEPVTKDQEARLAKAVSSAAEALGDEAHGVVLFVLWDKELMDERKQHICVSSAFAVNPTALGKSRIDRVLNFIMAVPDHARDWVARMSAGDLKHVDRERQ